jgi:hypothetical protein
MDQFCAVKNASYQRCSCSDRIYDIVAAQNVMEDAGAQLTAFTENLDVVGMSAAQATAMRNASEGELALTGDKSASKALLQAIMNSIKGEDTNVGGVYEGLNTISIKMDDSAGFGFVDSGQAIATYNGKNLYSAIYGKCREAVRNDCNDASLQRSVTAYLMAVEQDCNTVQKQLDETKKKMTAAVREGGAMLDLARVKDRQERNSSDATACLREVENAVMSDEVCGGGYRKCLDNGKYIDVATGKPMQGVVEFYKLQELLNFAQNISLGEQKLAKNPSNRTFVGNFEKKVKQFAQPALDKCVDIADQVWADYLDKAMLDIYYAQREKVDEIKTGCMDFVSACYMNGSQAITSAMSGLVNGTTNIMPQTIELLDATCKNYVSACDKMFGDGNGNGIIAQYIESRKTQDLTDSCRAVAKQCFDDFGGVSYSNFYNPISGLFSAGRALDWFTFDSHNYSGANYNEANAEISVVSVCAKRLLEVAACNPPDNPNFAREIFGGFDRSQRTDAGSVYLSYGLRVDDDAYASTGWISSSQMKKDGIATEIYNQIANSLSSDCKNMGGRFVQKRFLSTELYPQDPGDRGFCISSFGIQGLPVQSLLAPYRIGTANDGKENMCPMGYWSKVDTLSWGVCSCWENGGRRSNNGLSLRCVPGRYQYSGGLPAGGMNCTAAECDRAVLSNPARPNDRDKVCPYGLSTTTGECANTTNGTGVFGDINLVPEVPQ